MPMKSKFPTRTIFVWAIFYALIIVIVGELFFRFISKDKVWTPQELKEQSWQLDPVVFAQHVFPQKEQLFTDKQWAKKKTGYLKRYVNEHGYRGPTFAPDKPKGTIRIMTYGGSFVFDIFASLNQDWAHQLEQILHQKGYSNVEIINAGTPGHRSSDSLGRLFSEGHRFDPDIVIFCNTFNDIKFFNSQKTLLRELIPYRPEINPMINYQGRLDQKLCEWSKFYTFVRQEYYQRKYDVGIEGARRGHNHKYFEANQISNRALRQFKLNAELFVDTAQNIGAVPVIVTQPRLMTPTNATVESQKLANFKRMFKHHDYVIRCFEAANSALKSISSAKKVTLIDAASQFTGDTEMFIDHIHLSEAGSHRLASYLADQLIPVLNTLPK